MPRRKTTVDVLFIEVRRLTLHGLKPTREHLDGLLMAADKVMTSGDLEFAPAEAIVMVQAAMTHATAGPSKETLAALGTAGKLMAHRFAMDARRDEKFAETHGQGPSQPVTESDFDYWWKQGDMA